MDYSNTTDTIAEAINVNDNSHLSTFGLVETLVLSMIAFSILMTVFESNRFYKQIYLKRLQNRFRVRDSNNMCLFLTTTSFLEK